jgi:AcrR family transcriptional regulator
MSRIPGPADLDAAAPTAAAPTAAGPTAGPGRPRDGSIDGRVLAVTREQLATVGYDALSLSAVAAASGTTRAALYRRWSDKADLATAAIAALPDADPVPCTDDPFADLVAELERFRRGVGRPDGVSMVGTMLVSSTDPGLVARYRERVVAPRRRRLRSVLERARARGLLDADADLEVVVTMSTGSWYARALAGDRPPPRWAERTATLVWRACGGQDRSR